VDSRGDFGEGYSCEVYVILLDFVGKPGKEGKFTRCAFSSEILIEEITR
jgi:hypothetical protein